jgi:hypothetical protein
MRLIVRLLGCEVLTVSTDRPEQPTADHDHDHTAAQVERSEPAPLGFHVDPIPSLTNEPTWSADGDQARV